MSGDLMKNPVILGHVMPDLVSGYLATASVMSGDLQLILKLVPHQLTFSDTPVLLSSLWCY